MNLLLVSYSGSPLDNALHAVAFRCLLAVVLGEE
jgi:hypothetical protein